MAFLEVQFPVSIGYGSSGGPMFSTQIVTTGSGYEQRNSLWSRPLWVYDASTGVKSTNDIYLVRNFFYNTKGRLLGFRWKDTLDYKSSLPQNNITFLDQVIGVGNGTLTQFQIIKSYSGQPNYERVINKPVVNTVLVGVNQTPMTGGFSVDSTTGIISFQVAPLNGAIISVGYEFDVPARFDIDQLTQTMETYNGGSMNTIPIKEIRL